MEGDLKVAFLFFLFSLFGILFINGRICMYTSPSLVFFFNLFIILRNLYCKIENLNLCKNHFILELKKTLLIKSCEFEIVQMKKFELESFKIRKFLSITALSNMNISKFISVPFFKFRN